MTKDILITSNHALNDGATSGQTSSVGEPSVATNGSKIFVTGNWYATRSTNNGSNWAYVDPYSTTPPAAGGFCCDQLTLFDTQRQIWIWILQYRQKDDTNVFRIAICPDADLATNNWHWWDIAPAMVDDTWSNLWFDYPDASLSSDHLYVTFNMFDSSDAWHRATVMRFPLDILANGGSLDYDHWTTTDNGSLRLTQQASPTGEMYFLSHNHTAQVRLFSWPDNANAIDHWDIPVNQWNWPISSTAPNGVDWLARASSRVTGATLGNGKITLTWTAGSGGGRPHPHVRVVQIDENNKSVINQPDLWSDNRAWAYPAVCCNSDGVLGISAFYGGEDRHPAHVVGAYDSGTNNWVTRNSRLGSHSPIQGKWGDYLNCRADVPSSKSWVASGYTQEGGENRTDIVPRVVRYSMVDTIPVNRVINCFGYTSRSWRVEKHPRFMADITGDGRADIVGFGNTGVYVSCSNPDGTFSPARRVIRNFGYSAGGWRTSRHPRMMADTTGDGRADIVGFGYAGVYVACANSDGSFGPIRKVVNNFGYGAGGWRVDRHPRMMADTTGNGCADIIGFGYRGVYVSRAVSGGAFESVQRVMNEFGYADGWRVDTTPRLVQDVTGDGRADIVGFGYDGVYISRVKADGSFVQARLVKDGFGFSAGDWRVEKHPRFMADITGNGFADIIGFGDEGVYVSLADDEGEYGEITLALEAFGFDAGGWRVNKHPRYLADTTGDGRADIVGFGEEGVYIAVSRGDGTFEPPRRILDNFGYSAGGWRVEKHPRMLADVNGDGKADIVGFGSAGVYVSLSQ